MRRIGLTILLLVTAAGATLVASAGATDTNTYEVELDNAFGLVNGSEVRVAGVKGGTVTELDVNDAKKALITISVEKQFGEFKQDATCSSEPQSLIAEYFLDCQPGQSPQPLQGPVPVEQTTITVPQDLVQNTLRQPFKQQLALLINEFGTALTGNAENLNAAILRGAPALRELKTALDVLAKQNTVIRDLNANSDAVIAKLNNRREDVVRFIKEADGAAAASAERRTDLSLDFERLPDFLAELQPTMVELGHLAENGQPLLSELNRSAGNLATLSRVLPPFNDASNVSLTGLGDAAEVGTQALTNGREEIRQIRASTVNAKAAGTKLSAFFDSIDSPRNAVEEDARARTDLRDQPGEADRRVALLRQKVGGAVTEPGYTGLEGLLNYLYYQAGALNQFDQIGHLLHFILYSPGASPCAHYHEGPTYPGGTTPHNAPPCVSILGDNQPGIGIPGQGATVDNGYLQDSGLTANLSPYDPSVCPSGSTEPQICAPPSSQAANRERSREAAPQADAPQDAVTPEVIKNIKKGKKLPKPIRDLLGLPGKPAVGGTLNQLLDTLGIGPTPVGPQGGGAGGATGLLNFLFGQ